MRGESWLSVTLPRMRFFTIGLLASCALTLSAQTPDRIRLVMPKGNGSILVPLGDGFQLKQVALYDENTRADLFLDNNKTGISVSYLLFPTDQYTNTTEKCRNSVLEGVVEGALSKATLKDKRADTRALSNGQQLSIGSYVIEENLGLKMNQKNVFGFFVSGSTCGEIHLSKTPTTPGDEQLFNAALDSFNFDPTYVPQPADYKALAKILSEQLHDNAAAKTYLTAANSFSLDSAGSSPTEATLKFAMPDHPGYLQMEAPNYEVTELSAKPNGKEFGIRADNKVTMTQVLGFLYLPDGHSGDDAASCRETQLHSEENRGYRKMIARREITSASGVPIAIVEYEQSKNPAPYSTVIRAFVAKKGVCADIETMGRAGISPELSNKLFATIQFDPDREPDFPSKFMYAMVLYEHHAYAAAAALYESLIPSADKTDDPVKMRRILADKASTSYGMSGDLVHSRTINEAAIAKDPGYPFYYYNLACADAEDGNANAAKIHLEQAFARKANVIPGETLPNPAQDDSFLKLKSNKQFWSFIQSLPKS